MTHAPSSKSPDIARRPLRAGQDASLDAGQAIRIATKAIAASAQFRAAPQLGCDLDPVIAVEASRDENAAPTLRPSARDDNAGANHAIRTVERGRRRDHESGVGRRDSL